MSHSENRISPWPQPQEKNHAMKSLRKTEARVVTVDASWRRKTVQTKILRYKYPLQSFHQQIFYLSTPIRQSSSAAKPSKKGFSLGAPLLVSKKDEKMRTENDSAANEKPNSGLQLQKKQSISVKKKESTSEVSVIRRNVQRKWIEGIDALIKISMYRTNPRLEERKRKQRRNLRNLR